MKTQKSPPIYHFQGPFRFLSNLSSTIIQGSKQLIESGNHCILSKSLKDTMLLNEFGFISCAPNAESVTITKSQFDKLSQKYNEMTLKNKSYYSLVKEYNLIEELKQSAK